MFTVGTDTRSAQWGSTFYVMMLCSYWGLSTTQSKFTVTLTFGFFTPDPPFLSQLISLVFLQPGFLFQYEPELDAFLEFLIWRFSIWVDKPTPGNALMNLRYRDEHHVPVSGKDGNHNQP